MDPYCISFVSSLVGWFIWNLLSLKHYNHIVMSDGFNDSSIMKPKMIFLQNASLFAYITEYNASKGAVKFFNGTKQKNVNQWFLFLGKTQFLGVNLINTNHHHEAIIFFSPSNGFSLQQLYNKPFVLGTFLVITQYDFDVLKR